MKEYCGEPAQQTFIDELCAASNKSCVLTEAFDKASYTQGFRVGCGEALAVVVPRNLLEMWRVLEVGVRHDVIVIMHAANTGLTGGSTLTELENALKPHQREPHSVIGSSCTGALVIGGVCKIRAAHSFAAGLRLRKNHCSRASIRAENLS